MLRHIFYALLGGYFVAGLLIGLNWLIAVDLVRSQQYSRQNMLLRRFKTTERQAQRVRMTLMSS